MTQSWLELTGLWRSKRNPEILVGTMGYNISVVIKPNDHKKSDNQPDYVLLLTNKNRGNGDSGNEDRL